MKASPAIKIPAGSVHHFSESACVQALLPILETLRPLQPTIQDEALRYAGLMRQEAAQGQGVEGFISTYGMNSREGIALLCVAEALLRIPDTQTADALIDDSFCSTRWEKFLGKSASLQVNAATWGLMLTGRILDITSNTADQRMWKQLLERYGEPAIREALRKAMRFMSSQFILGRDVRSALDEAATLRKQGCRLSLDMLGEGARSKAQAEKYLQAYHGAIDALQPSIDTDLPLHHRHSISIKLSALHPRYLWVQRERVMHELLPSVRELLEHAQEAGIAVSIDAEEAHRFDIGFELFSALLADPALSGYDGLGYVLQAYQTRALATVDALAALAEEHRKIIPIRLVKGAYWDSEIKLAQQQGLSAYPVFTRKAHTDLSYLACATRILQHKGLFFPQFATHNPHTAASVIALAGEADFECQRLYGMGKALHAELRKENIASRIYAPIGHYRDLLPYLIRRMLENGASTSFLQQLSNPETALETLVKDPQESAAEIGYASHNRLNLPEDLYGAERRNSPGLDFGNREQMRALSSATGFFRNHRWQAAPNAQTESDAPLAEHRVLSPANTADEVGQVKEASAACADLAMQQAAAAFSSWSSTPAAERADCLDRLANLFWRHRHALLALLAREAGRTLADGLSEVREAMDFCRYYAMQARQQFAHPLRLPGPTGEENLLSLHGRGVFACISPWNFPLAIFTGQVTAALAAGNTVIAKPARQTPLVARYAVNLMHEAGIPEAAVHYLPGPGAELGNALTAHPALAGIAFTGSTGVAQQINRALAARNDAILPFIAETGGQNCMIVDSSALLEQTVDDVLISAFGSAGQRCSALRVLFVQEDIYSALISLLKDAMQELRIGHPLDLATDVGPVIDAAAKRGLQAHIERMEKEATLLAQAPIDTALLAQGSYLPPHAFEIESISQLKEEVFGPVLHILPYAASQLEQVITDINGTGFGLTFGVQSRITKRALDIAEKIHAGNRYVNRSMIGATVGVQPFGGEGASGTGPKAGGPHYLTRFATERVTSHNTAALGGNVTLLSGG